MALTRAKGWVKLSGVGSYPLYEEMWRVMQSGDTFTFTFRHPPQREISVTDVGEVRSRYQSGGRNFQNADLAGADLREADLTGPNLDKADLSDVNLEGARMPDGSICDYC
ncbi:MAG: pentapeptide repeat-containing protein [Coleofasciculus sp. G3-WIS-01]|uniref:pentapeptide repeat-containing protein n=1 Tax=Coleofasciculus sp. G3-WIS-01 TaxID=3069528 RepID=UPI0033004353